MSLLNPKPEPVIGPPQDEWIEKASVVRDYWSEKLGSYTDTSDGIEDISFTELNERRAQARVAAFERLMERGKRGALTPFEVDDIKKAYRRVPRDFKP